MKYYVLGIWCDVEPLLSKAFDTKEERDNEARRMRKEDDEMDDSGIYRLDIDNVGNASVDSYLGFELDPESILEDEEE